MLHRYVRVLVVLCVAAVAVTAQGVNDTEQHVSDKVVQAVESVPVEKPIEAVKSVPVEVAVKSVPEAVKNVSVEAPVVPVIVPRLAVSITKEDAKSDLKKTLFTAPVVFKSGLGSKCANNSDCTSNNTYCEIQVGLCVCMVNYIPSKFNISACVKVPSGMGDACEEEAQCEHAVPDSECISGKCQCPPNYVNSIGRCWQKQMLGGNCNVTLQCSDVEFGFCTQGVCSCTDPYIPSPINKCLTPAGEDYEAPCVEDIQCSYSYGDEARCNHNMCRCTSNFHYNGTKCVVDKKLGDDCTEDVDCKISENSDSRTCLRNYCSCATGYNSLPNEDICTKSSGEELAVSLTWILCIVVAKYYLA